MTDRENQMGQDPSGHEFKDEGQEIDLTEVLLSSSPSEFAEKISVYSDSDKLIVHLKIAEANPDFIRRFVSGGSKRYVRIHCSLDDFDKYSNSEMFPHNKNLEWVVE